MRISLPHYRQNVLIIGSLLLKFSSPIPLVGELEDRFWRDLVFGRVFLAVIQGKVQGAINLCDPCPLVVPTGFHNSQGR